MRDPSVQLGSLRLANPVMTASGTAGHDTELAAYVDLSRLGAVVVKSLSAEPWPGNPAPRLHPTPQGMVNAVGLQGPGLGHWIAHSLPRLRDVGATVVVSIWGRTIEEYRRAAELIAPLGSEVIAVEVNLSCPNLEGRGAIFAHDPVRSAAVLEATALVERPRWAKLSPNTDRIVEVAAAVHAAGAEAVTLINTVLAMVIDPETLRPVLGAGGGGLSGRAIHPVAVRAVHDVRAALPEVPIIGVGGVASGWDAAELMLVGAQAIQVGTATFADPRAPERVLDELLRWVDERGIAQFDQLSALA